jgi:hypothetical protein
MIGFVLFTVAVIMAAFLYPIGIIYGAAKVSLLYASSILKTFSIGISQFGNVACSELFNDTLIKKGGHKFGNPTESTSRVLGINKRNGTLSKIGIFVANVLNCIDPNHVEDSSK